MPLRRELLPEHRPTELKDCECPGHGNQRKDEDRNQEAARAHSIAAY
jgi:hypothetical protein